MLNNHILIRLSLMQDGQPRIFRIEATQVDTPKDIARTLCLQQRGLHLPTVLPLIQAACATIEREQRRAAQKAQLASWGVSNKKGQRTC